MKKLVIETISCAVAASAVAGTLTVGCPTANIGEFREMAKFAKEINATHLDACQIEQSLWQWNQNRYDPYPNWSMHRPAIFKFIVPPELKPYIPADYAKRNLDALRERAKVVKEFGFKADFWGMEPAYFPEQAYLDHPEWRGARCDQCRRARFEYYAPCVENAEVRRMYVDAVAELCKICPFERFKFRCNDSGSALCWSPHLYPGQNGPAACHNIPYGKRVAEAMSIFQEGAAKAGLDNVKVNLRANLGPAEAILPWLKPGQSINNRTATAATAQFTIGYPNRFTDYTLPLYAFTRLPALVEQLQKSQAKPDADVEIGLRSLHEYDAMELLRRYLRKPIGEGQEAKWRVVREIAETFVGKTKAMRLVKAWETSEASIRRTETLYTGGHLLLLGSLNQRWFIRPFVAFPNELQGEDRRFWREYLFQAQTEADAENMLDLQANRWLSGNGGLSLMSMLLGGGEGAIRLASQAAKLFDECRAYAVDEKAKYFLNAQAEKAEMYVLILRNVLNTVTFQSIIDRTDYAATPKDTSPRLDEQGDLRLYKLNEIVRSEIDNSLAMIRILESATDPVFEYAKTDAEETVMYLGTKAGIIRNLKRRIAIMEAHRRDFLRLYKSYNR